MHPDNVSRISLTYPDEVSGACSPHWLISENKDSIEGEGCQGQPLEMSSFPKPSSVGLRKPGAQNHTGLAL